MFNDSPFVLAHNTKAAANNRQKVEPSDVFSVCYTKRLCPRGNGCTEYNRSDCKFQTG